MPKNAPPIQMTRRVTFASGHRFWQDSLDADENHKLYGPLASPYNHGHNYVLDVTVAGRVDLTTGMVVNIKTIDEILRDRLVARMDGKSLNDEVPELASTTPCLENLMAFVWRDLTQPKVLPPECQLNKVRLEEMPTFYGEMDMKLNSLTRVYEFAASHRLHAPSLSDSVNQELFGKCNNPAGHGHNYILEVTVTGEPDPRTGMIVDLPKLDECINELVVDRYDHKNLSEDVPEFKDRPATSELVVAEIFKRLEDGLPAKLLRVRLHETARNIFEVCAS